MLQNRSSTWSGALAGNLDANDRFAGCHDRADDFLHRVGESGHAVPNRAPEMIFHRDAADFGQPLVDLQIAAVGRKEGNPIGAVS